MTDIKSPSVSDNPILRFAEALDRSIAQRRRELGLEPVSSLLVDLNALMKDPSTMARKVKVPRAAKAQREITRSSD